MRQAPLYRDELTQRVGQVGSEQQPRVRFRSDRVVVVVRLSGHPFLRVGRMRQPHMGEVRDRRQAGLIDGRQVRGVELGGSVSGAPNPSDAPSQVPGCAGRPHPPLQIHPDPAEHHGTTAVQPCGTAGNPHHVVEVSAPRRRIDRAVDVAHQIAPGGAGITAHRIPLETPLDPPDLRHLRCIGQQHLLRVVQVDQVLGAHLDQQLAPDHRGSSRSPAK